MITKILFTITVIIGVLFFFRVKNSRQTNSSAQAAEESAPKSSTLAYIFAGLLALVSAVFYYFHWQESHRILTIQVKNDLTGTTTIYKAYKSDVAGRQFITLDGKEVRLGDNDRTEITATE